MLTQNFKKIPTGIAGVPTNLVGLWKIIILCRLGMIWESIGWMEACLDWTENLVDSGQIKFPNYFSILAKNLKNISFSWTLLPFPWLPIKNIWWHSHRICSAVQFWSWNGSPSLLWISSLTVVHILHCTASGRRLTMIDWNRTLSFSTTFSLLLKCLL